MWVRKSKKHKWHLIESETIPLWENKMNVCFIKCTGRLFNKPTYKEIAINTPKFNKCKRCYLRKQPKFEN